MDNPLKGHSFPKADGFFVSNKNTAIDEYLYSISPRIKITSINTHAISRDTLNSIIKALSNSVKPNIMTDPSDSSKEKILPKYSDFSNNAMDKYLKTISESLEIRDSTSLPKSINLFFNTITNNAQREIELVITSSPQIKIDLTKGWKTNQSIFNFLKETLGNNTFGLLFGESGKSVSNIFSSTAAFAQNVMNMTGRDIQLGPYWSFSNNPLSNNPEFSMETVLINDCKEHWEDNSKIVELLTIDYLPTTEEKSNFKLKPPYLFNIEIGVDFGFIKKMYFCKATFNVTETGKYFFYEGKKIPEFFKVTCHFTSLLPDIQNLSNPGFEYKGTGENHSISYIQPKKETPVPPPMPYFPTPAQVAKENPSPKTEQEALAQNANERIRRITNGPPTPLQNQAVEDIRRIQETHDDPHSGLGWAEANWQMGEIERAVRISNGTY